MDYYPYGKILREYVLERARFQTTHHERDAETGLDYRGARFYDSDLGRFLSLDPLAMEFEQWSDYNYVLGAPLIFTDPSGRNVETSEMVGIETTYTFTDGGSVNLSGSEEPPINGIPIFGDDTGTYYWNEEEKYYEVYRINKNGTTTVGAYNLNGYEFKEPKGEYIMVFNPDNKNPPDKYDPDKTIWSVAAPFIASLATDTNPMNNITDQAKYPGVEIFSHPDMQGGITLGSIIIIQSGLSGSSLKNMLDHEYGHYLDYKFHFEYNQVNYLAYIGVPSIISTLSGGIHHKSEPERRANRLGGAWANNKFLMNKYRPK